MDVEKATKSIDRLVWVDLIAGQVVVTDEAEARLVNIGSEGELLSSKELWEGVTTVVWVMDLTDLNSVISQVVLYDKRKIFRLAEEAEHFTIVIKELLLASNFTTAEGLFHVLLHLVVTWTGNLNRGLSECIRGDGAAFWLALAKVLNLKLEILSNLRSEEE